MPCGNRTTSGPSRKALRILSILDIGYRQLTTSAKHPVRKLADAKGIKIRTPQNALIGVHVQGSWP